MDHSPDLDLHAPQPRPGTRPRLRDSTVLWLHRVAERRDWVPPEFGDDNPVDTSNAGSVLREWIRQGNRWAGHNPEEILALKAGAAALGVALVALIVVVRAIG